MTTDRDDIASLLAKVKAATGPDREIDRALAKMAGWREIQFTAPDINGSTNRLSVWMPDSADDDTIREYGDDVRSEVAANIWRDRGDVPEYTASIDAALAFGLKLNPDANNHGYDTVNGAVYAYLSRNNVPTGHWLSEVGCATVPLAFVAASIARLLTSLKENHP